MISVIVKQLNILEETHDNDKGRLMTVMYCVDCKES